MHCDVHTCKLTVYQFVHVLHRLTAEVDSEELSWVQSSVDEVITMLQQSPGLPSVPEVSKWFFFFLLFVF